MGNDELKIFQCPLTGEICDQGGCAMWVELKRDDGSIKLCGCSFNVMAKAMTNIATCGIEVYQSD